MQPIAFSMAFQPIVDVKTGRPFAYEALVRGPKGEAALTVLAQVNEGNRYAFDQTCRVKAITLASELGLPGTGAYLSINFLPGAVYSPSACIELTLKTAHQFQFPLDRLIFEITEGEEVSDRAKLQSIAEEYHRHGFQLAIDDFGAGFANLNLLADLTCNIVKLDMALIRNLHIRPKAETIVRSIAHMCEQFGVEVIAEGIETMDEYHVVRRCGIRLMQGYLLAKPGFEHLPQFIIPGSSSLQTDVLPLAPTDCDAEMCQQERETLSGKT